ncbi:hypothetical protein F5Y09DRAFT_310802 [Xylaria sp. FL1042]|nr:hypothetical protein F5Y09DRAFT_310802 [Xylaria sp. FL1042]
MRSKCNRRSAYMPVFIYIYAFHSHTLLTRYMEKGGCLMAFGLTDMHMWTISLCFFLLRTAISVSICLYVYLHTASLHECKELKHR